MIVSRIFTVLAIVATILLCIAIFLGLRIGKYNELYASFLSLNRQLEEMPVDTSPTKVEQLRSEATEVYRQLEPPREKSRIHMVLGIMAGLVAVLVNCISVTYFIGTSRWCKEVVDTYQLPVDLVKTSTKLKRQCFPWSLSGILVVMLIVGLGAASDPGTLRTTTPQWVKPHLFAALFGITWIAISLMVQVIKIRDNTEVVDKILTLVHQIRLERGLDADA